MSPPDSGRGPAANEAPHDQPVKRITRNFTAPPADPDYDDGVPELEGYETDPLTADEWSAICLAESREVALSEVAP